MVPPNGPLDPREFIRLHAGMPEHPKVDPLSDAAFRALVEAWCLCRRTRNDGRIPLVTWQKKWRARARNELVAVGLVELEEDAAVMHDWLGHQPSVAELDSKREVRAEAGRKGGVRSGESRRGASKPRTDREANASAVASTLLEPQLKQNPNGIEPELEIEEEKELDHLEGGSLVPNAPENAPPQPYCENHPGGTSDPCGACATKRKAWIAANLERDQRATAQAADRAETERQAKREAAELRGAAIRACQMCRDTNGYIGTAVCDHDPGRFERVQRGAALARQVLAARKTAPTEPAADTETTTADTDIEDHDDPD